MKPCAEPFSSTAMVEGVNAHLGETRHRGGVVEYRVQVYRDMLGERLRALEARANVTTAVTTELAR